MELCTGDTLESVINKSGGLNDDIVKLYVFQIVEGLKYIHSKNITHGYLKKKLDDVQIY